MGRKPTIKRDWLKDKYAQEWVSGLAKSTARNDISNFHMWINFTGMSSTEQIEKRMENLKPLFLPANQHWLRILTEKDRTMLFGRRK